MQQLVTLTIEWDAYHNPTDTLELYGLDAEVKGYPGVDPSKTLWWPHKADIAHDWLTDNGFAPVNYKQTSARKPFSGYKRLMSISFVREVHDA